MNPRGPCSPATAAPLFRRGQSVMPPTQRPTSPRGRGGSHGSGSGGVTPRPEGRARGPTASEKAGRGRAGGRRAAPRRPPAPAPCAALIGQGAHCGSCAVHARARLAFPPARHSTGSGGGGSQLLAAPPAAPRPEVWPRARCFRRGPPHRPSSRGR
eukprot:scaffold2149_cov406-Prasinococcus_capsulatus_cf.AAC.1